MKFKLVENYNDYALDDLRGLVQEYIYDAVDQLKGAPLETYLEWFKEQLSEYDDLTAEDVETVVTDVYIEAIDSGKIKRPKTMITSELKEYIESNIELLDKNIEELINTCPAHLKHELTLVLDKIDDSLTEELLTENTLTNIENIINTAFAGTGCVITIDPHKKFYLVRTPLNNTYCIPVVQQSVRSSNDYNKRRYRGNGTVVNGKLVDSSGTTLGPAYYGVPTNHNHYDYDDINLYQYSKHPAANGAGLSLSAFVQDVKSGKV